MKEIAVVDARVCCPDPPLRTKTTLPNLGLCSAKGNHLAPGNIFSLVAAPIQCLVNAGLWRPGPLEPRWDIYEGPFQNLSSYGITKASAAV